MNEFTQKLQLATKLVGLGKVSRRDFIQLALAAGIALPTATSMFSKAARAEPKRGGKFVMGMGHGGSTDTLDPALWTNDFVSDMSRGIWGAQLTNVNPKNAVVPHLAESFEPDKKAQKWVFKLRRGLTFHDGKTVTPRDVVESYNYHRNADSKSAVKSNLEIIDSIEPDGPDNVVFNLKTGSADFPYITSDCHLSIYKAKDEGGIDWQSGISCGPFILQEFNPGVKLTAKRNPNYFVADRPYFDEVEILAMVDATARTSSLSAGTVHYIDRPPLATIDQIKSIPNVEIIDTPGFGHYVAPMNVTKPPFDNVDVRLALKWAVNRQEIVDKIVYGYGKPGNDNPIAESVKFASNPQPTFEFDPEKAKYHLKKAGLTSLKVNLSATDAAFAGAINAALLMSQSAKQAGIDINVVREADDSFWTAVWMNRPWCLSYWSGRPTCDWLLTTAYKADAEWNETFWKNQRFNELLASARAETDEKLRADQYGEMQQLIHDDGGTIVLMFNNWVGAHSNALGHGDLNSNYDHDGGYLYERWWFK